MINFFFACLFILSTPGPGVLSTAGVGAAYGFRAGLAYIAGLFVGSNLVMLAVVSGLAAIVFQINGLRIALLIASTSYLIYLAARIAFAGSKVAFIHSEKQPGFWAAVTLQIINPKAYVVGTTMFSGFPINGSICRTKHNGPSTSSWQWQCWPLSGLPRSQCKGAD